MVRGGGARNMKYKAPRMAAIFFMTSFNRDREEPWGPAGSAAEIQLKLHFRKDSIAGAG